MMKGLKCQLSLLSNMPWLERKFKCHRKSSHIPCDQSSTYAFIYKNPTLAAGVFLTQGAFGRLGVIPVYFKELNM